MSVHLLHSASERVRMGACILQSVYVRGEQVLLSECALHYECERQSGFVNESESKV